MARYLYEYVGPGRNVPADTPVYRNGGWTTTARAQKGDVYEPDAEQVLRFRHNFVEVDERAYPPIPGEAGGAGEGGSSATAASAEPAEPTPGDEPDVVDIDLYREGDTAWYDLPNGQRVWGRAKALAALGVTDDG